MSGTMPTHLARAAVDAVHLLKGRGLIVESKPDQEMAPAVTTTPTPTGEWIARRGMAGSHYWHVEGRNGKRIAVAHQEGFARLIAAIPAMREYIASSASGGCATARAILRDIEVIEEPTT